MNTADIQTLATFAATLPILLVAHNLADHVTGQSDTMAAHKALPGAKGWAANLRHVGAYHLTLAAVGLLAWLTLPIHWSALGTALALGWSAATHALLDRRWPVRRILRAFRAGGFAELNSGGISGLYLSDQALHHAALLVCAILASTVR